MPFVIEVRCPTNRQTLATFLEYPRHYYRLDDAIEFPIKIGYAWCHKCERFVECEDLYSVAELQENVDRLVARKDQWESIDAEHIARRKELGLEFPQHLLQKNLFEAWSAAVQWRANRRSPPRCLECGSFFALKSLPRSETVPHPCGTGTVELSLGGHASIASAPERILFNSEGIRLPAE